MPFMEEDSTDSDGSSHCSGSSPQSTTTDATAVSTYQEYNGCQKRKRKAAESLPRKKSRMEPYFHGKALRMDSISGNAHRKPQKDEAIDLSNHPSNPNPDNCGGLPKPIWKTVFAYLPPRSLGALLSVNSVFHGLLTGSPKPGIGPISREGIHKDSERIWTLARQRHHSHFPRPLHGYRELDMWKLVGSVDCQFCARSLGSPVPSSDYHIGNNMTFQKPPRTDIYWPLAVRSCHKCLGKYFLTESELGLLGRSYLISSMNYAMVKNSPASLVSAPVPDSKIFLRSHMEWLHTETQKIAQDSSSAMADGWLRTYEMNARKRQRDAIRWERWEATNGRAKLFPHVGASPGRLVMSGASSPASSRRSSPIRRFQSPMSERRTSPARSESSTMGKNKNRGPQNKAQNGTSATGANAVPTASAPMSRAAFNYQTQPALPWNIAARNPAQHSAFAVPISSFCRPTPTLTNSLTCPADAAVPQTIQELSAVPIQPLPSVQPPAAAAPLTQLPSSIHTSQPFADVVPTSSAKDAKVAERSERRQSSIHPEETIKVGSDGPPKSRYRPRSRSPPGDRVRLYRERDYSGDNRVSRQYDYPVQPPAVRYAPRVLYDEYGYEYVCTGRRPTPYVLYELPPPRGY